MIQGRFRVCCNWAIFWVVICEGFTIRELQNMNMISTKSLGQNDDLGSCDSILPIGQLSGKNGV